MNSKTPAHLWDALRSATATQGFISEVSLDDYHNDLLLRSAVERQLEILGESLNRLRRDDPTTAARVPGLHAIIGMRNVLAHQYGTVDNTTVWQNATQNLPPLVTVLTTLLQEYDAGKLSALSDETTTSQKFGVNSKDDQENEH
ncbi:MAG: DUF86 domain-containing protein [Actinomycetaceae bacterium]|nr:DUF86 domain-containing protein [Actinomycetaceae bacterium]